MKPIDLFVFGSNPEPYLTIPHFTRFTNGMLENTHEAFDKLFDKGVYFPPSELRKQFMGGRQKYLISCRGIEHFVDHYFPDLSTEHRENITLWMQHFRTLQESSNAIQKVYTIKDPLEVAQGTIPPVPGPTTQVTIQVPEGASQEEAVQAYLDENKGKAELIAANEGLAAGLQAQSDVTAFGAACLNKPDTHGATWLGLNVFVDPTTQEGLAGAHANVLMHFFGLQRRQRKNWIVNKLAASPIYWAQQRGTKEHSDGSGDFLIEWGEWTMEGERIIRVAFAVYINEFGKIHTIDELNEMCKDKTFNLAKRQRTYLKNMVDAHRLRIKGEPKAKKKKPATKAKASKVKASKVKAPKSKASKKVKTKATKKKSTIKVSKVVNKPKKKHLTAAEVFEVNDRVLVPADKRRAELHRMAFTAKVTGINKETQELTVENAKGAAFTLKAKRARKLSNAPTT